MKPQPPFRKGSIIQDPGPGPARQYTLTSEPELRADGLWQATATLQVANKEPETITFLFYQNGTPGRLEDLGFERR